MKKYTDMTDDEKAEFDKGIEERNKKHDEMMKEWKEKVKYDDMTQEDKDAFDAKALEDFIDK